ncbi:TPA: hypothetical protein N0F65_011202 [Lagenidium giganteum]|uniref:Maltase n=1 Tax=Lagenidium giganteum TaxID=4803 RepID=A0AAV2ZC12_9STRA|nr:TPA: hypothetical protein N0F65_011202 [Lagenidium giganteum]
MVKIWNHCTQVVQTLLALGLALGNGQVLVKEGDDNMMHVLFQTKAWATPNIHFNTGNSWTGVPGLPMKPSTVGGNYSASDGWFQYDVEASQLEFVFNDNNGEWDNNDTHNYKVSKAGTWAVVSKKSGGDGPKPPQQSYVSNAGYQVTSVDESKDRVTLKLALNGGNETEPVYGADLKELIVDVTRSQEDTIRVKITDANNERWEVPASLYSKGELGQSDNGAQQQQRRKFGGKNSAYEFTYNKDPFTFQVKRKADGYVLFDSSKLSLVAKDQYLQISTAVPEDLSVYGIGESTRDSMRLAKGDKHTLWARDQGAMEKNVNLYGSHPFYMGLNGQGKAHGVLLLNSNGMDVTMEDDKLVYQTIGGVLDFHIVVGPTPADVVAQYTALVGRPKLQPYWSYGFHQCRWGYRSVEHLREVVDKYAEKKIPLDVMWADIDYMDKFHDFTLDPVNFTQPDMSKFLDDVHARGQKMVPIIDPGIPDDKNDYAYTKGLEMDVFIKDTAGKPYLGQVWPGPTVFPDFFHPNSTDYWTEQLERMHGLFPYDGLWIDMNELANFCPGTTCTRKEGVTCPQTGSIAKITTCCLQCSADGNKYDNPPFAINNVGSKDPINNKAISTSSLQYGNKRQYDTHNLYGFTEAIATTTAQEKLFNKRSFVLSRSTFPGSGAWTAHWTGDNAATWNDLQWSIPQMLNFGLYGIPMVGSDICGFAGDTTEELCARWTALGAFYPFSRNHNNLEAIPQETYLWESVTAIGQKFIGLRYRLLPYLYTLGYQAHVSGTPIARALFMEFPEDTNTHVSPAVDRQFMLGNSLLITPVLTKGAKSVTGYLPAGTWYNMFDHSRLESAGQSITWNVKLDDMPVLVRGGSILPMHQPALTSTAARESPYDILIAMPSNDDEAHGQLYLDDDEDINGTERSTVVQFKAETHLLIGTTFTSKVIKDDYNGPLASNTVNKIVVLGVAKQPKFVLANVVHRVKTFKYDASKKRLEIDLSSLEYKVTDRLTVLWK